MYLYSNIVPGAVGPAGGLRAAPLGVYLGNVRVGSVQMHTTNPVPLLQHCTWGGRTSRRLKASLALVGGFAAVASLRVDKDTGVRGRFAASLDYFEKVNSWHVVGAASSMDRVSVF